MSEEALKMYVELTQEISLCQDEDIKTLGKGVLELANNYDKSLKEIERLNKRIEDLNIINEEHRILNGMIRKQLQQKENIIKEAREYIKNTMEIDSEYPDYMQLEICEYQELLDILDKENK